MVPGVRAGRVGRLLGAYRFPSMPSRRHLPVGRPLRRNPFLRRLSFAYLVIWSVLAVSPWDRHTWLLENLLVFAGVGVLALTQSRFVFSNLSYGLIFAFLVLHAVGSHYTYSAVPIGAWLRDLFELERNHYDRVVHLVFGLTLAYPLRELSLRRIHAHDIWSYVVPILAILSMSSAYEIIEWWAARAVDPEVGLAYVGAQGDIWDGQKDMSLALIGAVVAMSITALLRRRTGREPYFGLGSTDCR